MERLALHLTYVAGPGFAPGLEDYEPSVRLYTTPRYVKVQFDYISIFYLHQSGQI